MTEEPLIRVRPYSAGDEAGILASFNVVFREVCGADFVDRDLATWRWQFAENPQGHRILVAATEDGVIAAHYGGLVYPAATAFGDATFAQAVDSFVHPDYRRGLKRPGLFVRTAQPWFDFCAESGDVLTYGYPVPAAERIGRRLVDYKMLRVVDYLCADLGAASAAAPAAVDVAPLAQLGPEVDALFARVAGERACWTRRDASYLDWRYQRAPQGGYEIYAARRDGALCGLMVLRPEHELVPDACTIADWVVGTEDTETADALVAAAVARGRERDRRTLLAVFADGAPEHAAMQRRGFVVTPSSNWLERRLAYRSFHEQMTAEWLAEHWWYTLGDSDLV
ncbi:MAG: hypothetical protein AAF628_14210 [Planctomycetota bacterium]